MDRRTTRRFFLLRPDADRRSQRLFYYCLGVYAAKHGVELHALVQMSTHWHVCLTDVRGVLPDFLADVHRTLALLLKAHREWEEEVWNKSQTTVIDIATSTAALTQLAYLMVNPIEAGMVERLEEYPGVVTRPEQVGRLTLTVKRPSSAYFSDDEKWPKSVSLSFSIPSLLEQELGEVKARRALIAAVKKQAGEARAKRAARGLGYLGAKAVCEAPIATMATKEEERGQRKPTFAVGPGEREAYRRKIEELREWRASYAKCLERWKAGERDVMWPPHTWKMCVLHGARSGSALE